MLPAYVSALLAVEYIFLIENLMGQVV